MARTRKNAPKPRARSEEFNPGFSLSIGVIIDRLAEELQVALSLNLAIHGDAMIKCSDVAPLLALADVHCERIAAIHSDLTKAHDANQQSPQVA